MRELKFRAWVSGPDYGWALPAGYTYFTFHDITDMGCLIVPDGDAWRRTCLGCAEDGEEHPEIEQYTGLTDSQGREIYEGDIVRLGPGPYGYGYPAGGELVEVEMAGCGWLPFADEFDNEPYPKADECEVVGNIHETPELLEDNDD